MKRAEKFLLLLIICSLPALITMVTWWALLGPGPLMWLLGACIFGFGLDVCLNGRDRGQPHD